MKSRMTSRTVSADKFSIAISAAHSYQAWAAFADMSETTYVKVPASLSRCVLPPASSNSLPIWGGCSLPQRLFTLRKKSWADGAGTESRRAEHADSRRGRPRRQAPASDHRALCGAEHPLTSSGQAQGYARSVRVLRFRASANVRISAVTLSSIPADLPQETIAFDEVKP
jgi:hypothetical protein